MAGIRVLSPVAGEALELLGARVRLERRRRRWTVEGLAERVGVSPTTIRKVERGDATVAIGTAFEAAVLVGVTLFHDDAARRALESDALAARLALLPAVVRPLRVDDDF
ncbi:MAG: helix-turn-helix transcriptional regulator [Acidimicrobiia bacterium]|nr:helix-turn-helix transcriptional regulator [Acidimicrobiia bacterium]MYC43935.1 helix-turn-helix transcriptional regulator [Acidimicrobiia bacterium]MYI21018.1 helix-turn-helix transcriptional regulator [Acidimicrobiia bacterium]